MRQEQATIFVAFDGKQFITKQECIEHENKLKTTFHFLVSILTPNLVAERFILLGIEGCKDKYEAKINAEYYLHEALGARIFIGEGNILRQLWTYKDISLDKDSQYVSEVRSYPSTQEITIRAIKCSK